MALAAAKQITINLRARTSQRDLIDRAAEVQGKHRTDFMLEAACERAEQVLLDKTFFDLDEERFKRFTELLEAPIKANEGLARLLKSQAPWER